MIQVQCALSTAFRLNNHIVGIRWPEQFIVWISGESVPIFNKRRCGSLITFRWYSIDADKTTNDFSTTFSSFIDVFFFYRMEIGDEFTLTTIWFVVDWKAYLVTYAHLILVESSFFVEAWYNANDLTLCKCTVECRFLPTKNEITLGVVQNVKYRLLWQQLTHRCNRKRTVHAMHTTPEGSAIEKKNTHTQNLSFQIQTTLFFVVLFGENNLLSIHWKSFQEFTWAPSSSL